MTKRTTDQWQALLVPELPERLWVEGSDWDDEPWDVCVQHPDWGVRSSIGWTESVEVAYLFAAAPEAVAEVVRLRAEIEAMRETLIYGITVLDRRAGREVDECEREVLARLAAERRANVQWFTRILEGTNDG